MKRPAGICACHEARTSDRAQTGVDPQGLDYRLLFHAAPDPCLVLDRELRIVAVNSAYLEATMTRCEEILGHGIFDIFPDNPDDPEANGVRNLRASLERVLKTGAQDSMPVQKYDIRRPSYQGGGFEVRYWSPINTPVLLPDQTLGYIIHRVQDVTEFVLARQQNAEAGLGDQKLERALQMDAESYSRAREVAEINLKLKQANAELEAKNEELSELNQRLKEEAAGRLRAQEALRLANAELERSNKDLELFASVASHDLQEPLHTITSYTELLAHKYQGKLDAKAEQYVSFIIDGTNHMHTMINDLLAYSRVGTRAKPFVSLDLNEVLDRALKGLGQFIRENNASFQRTDLPKVEGDDTQLTQLFQNLIANAIKFRKKEVPLEIRISCEPSELEWLIGVHDNGIGIEPRFFEQIFEIFRRLHTRQEYEGSGIGLAICKKIVEHHGGHIWVESTFGEGASIYFTLPARGALP